MQRQSLGSPSSKNSNAAAAADRRRSVTLAAEISSKSEKPLILRSYASGSEFSIHLIPILTLLCLLVLYLCSHDPSPTELVGIEGRLNRVLDRKVVSGERWIAGAAAGGGGGGVSVLRVHRKLRGFSSR